MRIKRDTMCSASSKINRDNSWCDAWDKLDREGDREIENREMHRESYSQGLVAEVGRLRRIQLMQLTIEYVEAEEAHFRLGDRRRLPRMRRAVSYDSAVARWQARRYAAAAQPLLLRATAAGGHVPPGRFTSEHYRLDSPSYSSSTRLLATMYSTSTSSPSRARSRPRSARCRASGDINSCFFARHL